MGTGSTFADNQANNGEELHQTVRNCYMLFPVKQDGLPNRRARRVGLSAMPDPRGAKKIAIGDGASHVGHVRAVLEAWVHGRFDVSTMRRCSKCSRARRKKKEGVKPSSISAARPIRAILESRRDQIPSFCHFAEEQEKS
jgi:hypothetical protein